MISLEPSGKLKSPRHHKTTSRMPAGLPSLAALLLATALTFSSTFHFGWVYDDPPQIPQNPNLLWSRLGFLFTHQLWASTAAAQSRFYRPFLTLWFLVNKTIFGLNPHWFHATTVLAHLTAVTLAFFIARSFLAETDSALFAAAIFALHPLQVESASWISAVNDPLAAAFCFASFLLYRKAIRRSTAGKFRRALGWALSAAVFLCALFTKEISLVLPAIILVDLSTIPRRERSENATDSLPPELCFFGIAAIFWLVLRSRALGGTVTVSAPVSWTTVLLTSPKVFLFSLYRIVLPAGLSPQYDLRIIDSAFTLQFFLCALPVLALIYVSILAAKRNPRLFVAYAWLLLPALPTLNLRWMNQNDFIHDRYTYMSMLGVALLAGWAYRLIRTQWPSQQLVRPLALALIVIVAFASAIQSQYWSSDVALFARAVSRAPDNEWAQLNYGSALSARGKFAEAAPHFVRSYELQPGWRAADFAAFAYQQAGDLSQAEGWFNRALQQDPSSAPAWFGLGQVELSRRRPQEAIPCLKKAIALDPTAPGFHYELGAALEQAARQAEAAEEYRAEWRLFPGQVGARHALDRLGSASNDPAK